MSQRIQHKRSSLPGKRPDGSYLEPGELALNTNSADPGVFFETNDGAIAKVGPTSMGVTAPQSEVGFGPGESWFDTGNATLNFWNQNTGQWEQAARPASNSYTIFVDSNSPSASDDLTNDGIARPFATLNRACIEVARRTILRQRDDDPLNARHSIILLPGTNIAHNEPGLTAKQFEEIIEPFQENQALTLNVLRYFNAVSGGVILPRGASIYGYDLRKTEIRPTFYPHWSREGISLGNIAPRTAIVKWTGNAFLNNVTFKDKTTAISVSNISGVDDEVAVLTSLHPHGCRSFLLEDGNAITGDTVNLTYPEGVSRSYDGKAIAAQGTYYVEPLSVRTFHLRKTDGSVLLRRDLPQAPGPNTAPPEFVQLEFTNSSHHRLSAVSYATKAELNEFYAKVQRAFSTLNYDGESNNSEINTGENAIVAPTPSIATVEVDSVSNGSPYALNVSLRSNWGMCGITNNGASVTGFKSVLASNFTSVSLQNDSEVFDVYYNKKWLPLKTAYAKANNVQLSTVTNDEALSFLVESVKLENLRFYYSHALDIASSDDKSSGLVDEISDTRHYSVMCENNGFVQIAQSFAVGPAVNYWAKSGGNLSISSANSNFGGQALRAEGFAGIGTSGGSEAPDRNFNMLGIRRPLAVSVSELKDTNNHKKIYINAGITSITSTTITLSQPFDKTAILPFTLKPGTAIWVDNIITGTPVKAILGSDPISSDGLTLTVSSNDMDGEDPANLSALYVRRFSDPRRDSDRTYSLWLTNTSNSHRPPAPGSVLRYSESPSPSSQNILVPGRQLDPGENGGWNHVFAVQGSMTRTDGDNPNEGGSDSVFPMERSTEYYVSLKLTDSFGAWGGSFQTPTSDDLTYSQGSYITSLDRPFYAAHNEISEVAVSPEEIQSVWERSRTFAICQPFDEAYFPAGFDLTKDPNENNYAEGSTYLRGIGVDRNNYHIDLAIDEDDGSDTLGLEGLGPLANYVDPDLLDPSFSHSKEAVVRFLNLLGYETAAIESLLKPQPWHLRNLSSGSLPALSGKGYALSTGRWPLEFNRSSKIVCSNHFWEWVGYFAYSKGLPQYQDNPLSRRQKYDYILSEAWGGEIACSGTTESGERVENGVITVDGRGVKLP